MEELHLDVDGRRYLLKLDHDSAMVFRNGEELRGYVPNALTVALANELLKARQEIEVLKTGDDNDI